MGKMNITNKTLIKMNTEELIEEIDKKAEKPFVTAQFGEHWKEHIRKQFNNGDVDIDMIINIAWKQGRKAILLEKALTQLIESKNLS
jgi:hypothetical protein